MPLKLNVGLSKKIGLPDYGSLGATCHVEVELDGFLIQNDLDAFHRHVANAYTACRQAVLDELARHQQPVANPDAISVAERMPTASQPSSRSASNGNGNGHTNGNGTAPQISAKQRNYVNNLSGQIDGLGAHGADALAERMFDKTVANLSSFEASALIDQLKAIKGGQISVEDVLKNGVAV